MIRYSRDFFLRYCRISIFLNLLLMITSFIYHLGVIFDLYGQILGLLFIIVFYYDLGIIVFSDRCLEKSKMGKLGKITNRLTYVYLLFIIFGVWTFLNLGGNIWPRVHYPIYYSIFGFSIFMAYLNLSLLNAKNLGNKAEEGYSTGKTIKIFKILLVLFCFFMFFICFFMVWALLNGGPKYLGMLTGMATGPSFGIFVLFVPVLIILFSRISVHRKVYLGFMSIGLVFTFIFYLPFLVVPVTIYGADTQFYDQFNPNWNTYDADIQEVFLDTQFVLSHYYMGVPSINKDNYETKTNLLYHKTADYELRYNVYYPTKDGLIGNNRTIIHIHGGGWVHGDIGRSSLALQEYLASQGYVVFDIQYRLLDFSLVKGIGLDFEFTANIPPDPDLMGQWTVYDMVSDIATFTHYLYNNNSYGADLSNVYFIGDSAGGYLTAMAGLAYNSNEWNFCKEGDFHVSGFIPIFPPNDARYYFYDVGISDTGLYFGAGIIPGNVTPEEDPDLYDTLTPSEHADSNDPPCLILQGTSDQMVPLINAQTIQKNMLDNNTISILVYGFFGGHGHTIGASYLTVAQYYLERFLYLTKN